MEDDVPTLEESGKIKEVSGKKREEEVKKKEEDGSKRKKLNLLTAALIEKILSMEKQSQQVKFSAWSFTSCLSLLHAISYYLSYHTSCHVLLFLPYPTYCHNLLPVIACFMSKLSFLF